ncbi:uncharacterized protein CLUP02_10053 [Colletotrichum lupini]|uniref:Uncharacterized protein n=1 Tax=Colletotrichum lupini TaxID=145971 RepID=A0A9Q8SVZ2_9PEZI|nr:uncharacterized protein CLUP02_10053 [Colletotrichum lupini]UQC84556.1 hypothetical protein CLUP02_10053 [Colletotrichum lupini]
MPIIDMLPRLMTAGFLRDNKSGSVRRIHVPRKTGWNQAGQCKVPLRTTSMKHWWMLKSLNTALTRPSIWVAALGKVGVHRGCTVFFAVRRQFEFPMASMGASCELPRPATHDAECFVIQELDVSYSVQRLETAVAKVGTSLLSHRGPVLGGMRTEDEKRHLTTRTLVSTCRTYISQGAGCTKIKSRAGPFRTLAIDWMEYASRERCRDVVPLACDDYDRTALEPFQRLNPWTSQQTRQPGLAWHHRQETQSRRLGRGTLFGPSRFFETRCFCRVSWPVVGRLFSTKTLNHQPTLLSLPVEHVGCKLSRTLELGGLTRLSCPDAVLGHDAANKMLTRIVVPRKGGRNSNISGRHEDMDRYRFSPRPVHDPITFEEAQAPSYGSRSLYPVNSATHTPGTAWNSAIWGDCRTSNVMSNL